MTLPQAILVDREVTGLLRHCIEKGKQGQAGLIVNQHPDSLNWQLIEFLELSGELDGLKNAEELTRGAGPGGFAVDTRQ